MRSDAVRLVLVRALGESLEIDEGLRSLVRSADTRATPQLFYHRFCVWPEGEAPEQLRQGVHFQNYTRLTSTTKRPRTAPHNDTQDHVPERSHTPLSAATE